MARILNNIGMGLLLFFRDMGARAGMRGIAKDTNATAAQVEAATARMNKAFGGMTQGLALAAAGFVGLGVMKKAADEAGEFEFEMAAVKQITGATLPLMEKLRERTIGAGLSLKQFAPAEAAKGLRLFAQAGFEANRAMDMITPTLDLAAASIGQLGLDDAAGLAVQGVKLFNKESLNTTAILDRMAKATLTSSLQFKDLPLAVGVAARGVVAFGAGIDDTLISLGLIRNIIPTVERGATALSTTMERIISPKTIGMIEELGLKYPIEESDKFLDAMAKLTFGMKDMGDKARGAWVTQAFGRRSMAGMLVLFRQLEEKANLAGGGFKGMTDAVKEMRRVMEDSKGTMAALRDELLNTFKGQKQVLEAATKGVLTVVGLQAVIPATKPIIDFLARALTGFAKLFQSLPTGFKQALGAVVIFASALMAIVGSFIAIKASLFLLGAAAISFKIILIVVVAAAAAIGALVAVIATLDSMWRNNVGNMQKFFLPLLEKAILLWKGLVSAIRIGGFGEELFKQLDKAGNKGILRFIVQIVMLIDRFKAFFSGISDGFKKANDFLDLGEDFADIWQMAVDVVMTLVDTFLDIGQSLGLLETGTTKSIKSWKEFGFVVGKVLAHIVKAFVFVMKLAVIPFVFMIKVLAGHIKALFRIISPLVRMIWKLGEALVLIFTSGPEAAMGALLEAYKSFIKAIAEMARSVVATLLRPLVDAADSILKAFGVDLEFMASAKTFLKKLDQPLDFRTPEQKARGLRIGRPVERKPAPSGFGPMPLSLSEFNAAALEDPAASQQGPAGPYTSVGEAPIVVETQTNLFLDTDKVLEAIDRRAAERTALGGGIRKKLGVFGNRTFN